MRQTLIQVFILVIIFYGFCAYAQSCTGEPFVIENNSGTLFNITSDGYCWCNNYIGNGTQLLITQNANLIETLNQLNNTINQLNNEIIQLNNTIGILQNKSGLQFIAFETTSTPFITDQVNTLLLIGIPINQFDSTYFMVSNNKITINKSGIYLISAQATFAPNNTGLRYLFLHDESTGDGVEVIGVHQQADPVTDTMMIINGMTNLSAGSTYGFYAWQHCSLSLQIGSNSGSSDKQTRAYMQFMGV